MVRRSERKARTTAGRLTGRSFGGLLTAILLGLLLAACEAFGGGGSTATAASSPPPPLRVAAAANLRSAMDELVARWRSGHPETPVEVVYGSSGNFFAQISQGAPFDLFFSADMDYPRQLVEAGLADGSTLRPYAVGQLVVWVSANSGLDVEQKGLEVIRDPSVQKVAIANPEHAPYGRAAVAALEKAGLAALAKPKLVLGDNVEQAAQFVESGNADVGIIPLSLAKGPTLAGRGRYAIVPRDLYPRLEQGAVVLAGTDQPAEARAFLDFVLGSEGRAILDSFGYLAP